MAHGLMLSWMGTGTWQRNQTAQATTPIELINLPESLAPPQTAVAVPPASGKGATKGATAAKSQAAPASPMPTVDRAQILAVAPSPQLDQPESKRAVASSQVPSSEPQSRLAPERPPAAAPNPTQQPAARSASDWGQLERQLNQAMLPTPQISPQVSPQASPQVSPQASPQISPQIITQPIDVPIPPGVEAGPTSSPEVANIPQRVLVPSHFTASLTATALPSETSPTPDETAQPAIEVKRVSRTFPCRVTPEVMQFLGKTVALQVATDASGQVINTATQESSDSLAYDQLATCLVKTWEFRPAIAQGRAVANDGLVVRITIDRS